MYMNSWFIKKHSNFLTELEMKYDSMQHFKYVHISTIQ